MGDFFSLQFNILEKLILTHPNVWLPTQRKEELGFIFFILPLSWVRVRATAPFIFAKCRLNFNSFISTF